MKNLKGLQIEQLDRKLRGFIEFPEIPTKGWIHGIRTSLKMSFRQFAKRMNLTPQSANEMEIREENGSISLKTLREVGKALDMKLVYGFIPKEGSFEKMIEQQALKVAKQIVMRTNNTMKLENQGISNSKLEKNVRELADELIREMPRYLWD